MIRIIKDGIKPKKYKYIYSYTCQNCTCEFEFEEEDCANIGEYRGKINCPFCSECLFIDFRTAKHREEEVVEEEIDLGDKTVIDMDDIYQWSPPLCKCPKCGSTNTLRNNSLVLTTWPAQYGFKCKDCGHRWTDYEPTLINPKVYDPWDNEHCNNCAAKNNIGDICNYCSHYPYKITCSNEVDKHE